MVTMPKMIISQHKKNSVLQEDSKRKDEIIDNLSTVLGHYAAERASKRQLH